MTMNRQTDTTTPEHRPADSPEPFSADVEAGTRASRPEAEAAAEERARTLARGSQPASASVPSAVRWVRVGDLLPQLTAAASGRGINVQTEVASRTRRASLDALRSAGHAATALPQQALFGTLARLGRTTTPQAQGRGIQ